MFSAPKRSPDRGLTRQDDDPDARVRALKGIIKWQSRFFILLTIVFVVTLAFYALKIEVTLPDQEAVQDAPPISDIDVQYNTFAYHSTDLLADGAVVHDPEILLMGQIYEYAVVRKQWPDIRLTINEATMQLEKPAGGYKTNFTLKPGRNVIETAIYWNNVKHGKQQFVINYEPEP